MISKDIIDTVLSKFTRAGKFSANKVRDYILEYEPEFNKYLQTSTFTDIKKMVEKLGLPPQKEIVDGITSILVGAKIEGFLIHSIGQEKFWAGKYGLDISGVLKPEDKFELFIEGKLNSSHYNYKLSKEEINDKDNYKTKALKNFKKNQEKRKIENEIEIIEQKCNKDNKENIKPKKTVSNLLE